MPSDKNWVVRMSDGLEVRVTGSQVQAIVKAAEAGAKFAHLGDRVINPSFVERMWEVKDSEPFPNHPEVKMSEERMAEGIRRLKEIVDQF